jgi:hypothetical protein
LSIFDLNIKHKSGITAKNKNNKNREQSKERAFLHIPLVVILNEGFAK